MIKSIYTKESDLLREWLTDKRIDAGLSIRDVGSLLGIHHSIWGKIESGQRQVAVVELLTYCEALNANPIELIEKLLEIRN